MSQPPDKWVSLRDVAAKTELSRSTVSMALRNHPDISQRTRERVCAVAREMGYSPNPFISRVSKRRGSPERAGPRPLVEIAYVSSGRYYVKAETMMAEAEQRVGEEQSFAASMGYKLVVHHLAKSDEAPESMGARLYNRGCDAVIVGPLRRKDFANRFPWQHFTCVCMGGFGSCDILPVHTIMDDPFRKIERAWSELRARGYRRPGLALLWEPADTPERSLMQGAWLRCLETDPNRPVRIPWLEIKAFGETPRFQTWLRRSKPDVVVAYNTAIRGMLADHGIPWPEGVGLVTMHASDSAYRAQGGVCGFTDTWHVQLQTAITLIDQEIRLFRRGLPEHRQVVHIDSPWHEGDSLPRKS
jgi:DNA-binding LacI/PurR family transcriptional regulator